MQFNIDNTHRNLIAEILVLIPQVESVCPGFTGVTKDTLFRMTYSALIDYSVGLHEYLSTRRNAAHCSAVYGVE